MLDWLLCKTSEIHHDKTALTSRTRPPARKRGGGKPGWVSHKIEAMPFPIKVCSICEEEFELKPDKPGFANRCPECSDPEASVDTTAQGPMDAIERKNKAEANEARREAMKNLLYRKDS
jgi:hypothetical protein